MDSVRCTKDASHEFTCEVEVGSDFDTPEPEAARSTQSLPAPQVPPPASPPPQSNPAVSTLVSSFPPNATVYKLPAPPIITAAVATECASQGLGFVLATLSKSKNPIVTGLTILKASYDFAMCAQKVQQQEAQRVGENYCHDLGGVVTGVITGEGPLRVNCKVESTR